jgi:large subunit ribosomal protein L23
MAGLETIIIKPLITEKISQLSEAQNKYGFQVLLSASKTQIKAAVEKIYDVKVVNIRTTITPGKTKRAGSRVKKLSKTKKAIIALKEGQKIEFFKGV